MYQKKLLFASLLSKNDQKQIKGGDGNGSCNLLHVCLIEGDRCGSDDCICEIINCGWLACMPQNIVKVPAC
jgi:hypothetical protein